MNIKLRHIISILIIVVGTYFPGLSFALPEIYSVTPDNTTIAKFDKLELTVSLSATYSNPYDYGQVSLKGVFISPSGEQYFMDGFYFQDYLMTAPDVLQTSGPPGWRIRFSPNETGEWVYYVVVADANGSDTYAAQTFTCVTSTRKGFVKKEGNRFVYSNGETFHGLGTNLAWQWWWAGFTIYEDWINALSDNGGNFTKLTMAPWIFEIEWTETGVGQYTQRQNRAWVLDWVFEQLIEKDIYCILNPMIHDELRLDSWTGWDVNPYNQANGGPCNEPQNFLVNETAIQLYKQKLRYINARWGYSPQVAMWEQLSESDNTGIYNEFYTQSLSWMNTMTEYMISIDVYNRPVSSAYTIPQRDPAYWNNPNTGFTQQHLYDFTADLEMKIYNYTQDYLEAWNKPFLVGEFALGHDADEVKAQDPQGIAFHNVLWSSMFSGSFGSAMSWYWDNYLYPNELFDHLHAISEFMEVIDEDVSLLEPLVPLCTSNVNNDVSIEPDYNNDNEKAPENYFYHDPSGLLKPTVSHMGKFLYGSFYNGRKNPPTFKVNYTRFGEFKVRTGDVALFSKIKIKIDGTEVFEQSVSSHTTYAVPVTIGEHEIKIENSGSGILKIENYQFLNYSPQLRSFAMANDHYAAGWYQNTRYNWEYINQFGVPFAVSNGEIYLEFGKQGVFDIYWYNADAILDSVQTVFNTEDELVLSTPNIVWDGAWEVKYISPVEVQFTASPLSGDAPLDIQFTDQSLNSGGNIDAWSWDFGDGNTSDQQNPQHTYTTPGTYTVSLEIISGQYSNSLTKENYISASQELLADFITDTTIALPNEIIQFTDLSLGDPESWLWTFGDNSLSFSSNPSHSYSESGIYSISLLVENDTHSDIETKLDYIQILSPLEASFYADKNLSVVNDVIQFTDASTGNPSSWNWNFGDGTTSTLQHPTKMYAVSGVYPVKLSVQTAYFEDSLIKQDYITILEPLSADFTADTLTTWLGQNIQFTNLSTGNPDEWLWDFGDNGQSSQQHPAHAYPESGMYSISLQISDTLQSDVKLRENYIRVRDTLDANFTVDTSIIALSDRAYFSDLSKGDPQTWFWNFNDGFASELQNPSHKFKSVGEFSISLQVTRNDSTNIEIKENFVTVIPNLVADFSADTLFALAGEQIQFFDESDGNPTTWHWDFGNNSNNNGQNPTTSYENPGNYTVSLIVFNDYLSDTITKESYINIIEAIEANFTVNPFETRIGEEVHFTDLSTGFPNQWEWWLGNGDTSFVQNPSTSYFEPGLYDITLIAKNEFLDDTLSIADFIYVLPPFYTQNILLRQGWSGISTFVKPLYPAIDEILEPVDEQFFFAKNEQGIYSPSLNINTLGNWDTKQGLFIFMDQEASISIEGYEKVENNLALDQGWSLLPVYSPCSYSTIQAHEFLDNDLKLIKEIAGHKSYWPEMGISTLDTIHSGAMYMIYMNQPKEFSFPTCE